MSITDSLLRDTNKFKSLNFLGGLGLFEFIQQLTTTTITKKQFKPKKKKKPPTKKKPQTKTKTKKTLNEKKNPKRKKKKTTGNTTEFNIYKSE